MIFLTVGHQSPFDRLIKAVDEWAARQAGARVFAQIGLGNYLPRYMEWTRWLSADEFERRVREAEAVVAHAGTGTIIQVLLCNKPLLVLPRLVALGETRSDHQVGTARYFAEQGYIQAAEDERTLVEKLGSFTSLMPVKALRPQASPELIDRLRIFVDGGVSPQVVVSTLQKLPQDAKGAPEDQRQRLPSGQRARN